MHSDAMFNAAFRDNRSSSSASMHTSEEQRKDEGNKIVIEGVSYTRGKKIARGGSGSVWQITREVDGAHFALKEASLQRNGAIYRGEVDRLQALKDAPHIIALIAHDLTAKDQILRMVLELGEIDLECELRRQNGKFDKATTRTFALEIARGIKEMHDHSIIHLDMKLANVLKVHGALKIVDLGLSASLGKEDFIIRDFMFGSNRPPEQIVPRSDGTYKLTKKVDIWGFGVVVYQMTYGRRPFSDHPEKTMIAILDPNVRIQHDLKADPIITEFLEMCTVREVEKRATIEQLLQHRYLAEASPLTVSVPGTPGNITATPSSRTHVLSNVLNEAMNTTPTLQDPSERK
ncbi:kinase domain protein [Ancylostoma duodenale]|uniref:Kinase domain protein n=1 Tax=Ancylostoma duodenale TaxID=51022 RepID=A0A0C2DB97_9BILA|nr:kinase domain protein [Ancylostoma duodenale]